MECSNLVEEVFLERGTLLGVIGGLIVFICIFSYIIYDHSDFDGQLIQQVDNGVPAEKLIPQINEETAKLQTSAKRRLESFIMDKKNWGNGDLVSPKEFSYNIQYYESEMKVISEYDGIRKKFAKREITKEQFLQEIKGPKEYFNIY